MAHWSSPGASSPCDTGEVPSSPWASASHQNIIFCDTTGAVISSTYPGMPPLSHILFRAL